MSAADTLLARLDGMRQVGPGRWIARCPAHDDRRPSLSVRELEDGRVLVHCFANCDVGGVLKAVGLEFDALFPERRHDAQRQPRERRPFVAADALRLIEYETFFVATAARKLAEGRPLDAPEHARLLEAICRITNARSACGIEAAL